MYYRGAAAAILVFDVSENEGPTNLSLDAVKMWVKELQEHDDVGDDIVLAIAANKCDMLPNQNLRDVPVIREAAEYAQSIKASLWATSAKTAQGLEEMFVTVAKQLLKVKLRNDELNGEMRKDTVNLNEPLERQQQGGCCS